MGVNFVKGRGRQDRGDGRRRPPAQATRDISGGERHEGGATRLGGVVGRTFRQSRRRSRIIKGADVEADAFNYVREVDEDLEPGRTTVDGVFVAGTAGRYPRHSRTPSCMPARRHCRWRPICAKSRREPMSAQTARRLHLPLRRQHLRLCRRAEGVRRRPQETVRLRAGDRPSCSRARTPRRKR